MSQLINIKRDVDDPFYRYKMPRIQAKVEGRGNGIKTLIVNMYDVAKALHRPPTYITRYFGTELGALSTCDDPNSRYIINGVHDAEKLQFTLDGFIKKFVLCSKCENPETIINVTAGGQKIMKRCKACGAKGEVDSTHRLCAFIRANPPPKEPKIKQAKDNKVLEDEKKASALQADDEVIEGIQAPEGFDEGFQDQDQDKRDYNLELASLEEDPNQSDIANLSQALKHKLGLETRSKKKSKDDNDSISHPLDLFGDYLQNNPNLSPQDLQTQIQERDLKPFEAMAVLTQTLVLDDLPRSLKTFLQHFLLLIQMNTNSPSLHSINSKEKCQLAFLGSLDRIAGHLNPKKFLPMMPTILQTAYNLDIINEEVVSKWKIQSSKRYSSKEEGIKVREASKSFFEWLEMSEDDDNDDNENEDESDQDEDEDESDKEAY